MIVVTHDFGIVAKVCNRVAVMYAGRIVEYAGIRDLFNSPLHPYTQSPDGFYTQDGGNGRQALLD